MQRTCVYHDNLCLVLLFITKTWATKMTIGFNIFLTVSKQIKYYQLYKFSSWAENFLWFSIPTDTEQIMSGKNDLLLLCFHSFP